MFSHLSPAILTATLTVAFASTAHAQRQTAELAWKKHEVAIEYGAVPVGKHSLSSLAVGADWRLGMNEATVIRLDVPLFEGDAIAAPGSYRAKLFRASEDELHLRIEGAGRALDARAADVNLSGTLSETKKPGKKLELEFAKAKSQGKAKKHATSSLAVEFGETTLTVPVDTVDATEHKSKGFVARVFTWPVDTIRERQEKKLPTPIASISRKKPKKGETPHYNVVLEGDDVRLVPWMTAPTDSFGFGEIHPPPKDGIVRGTLQWTDVEPSPVPTFAYGEKFKASKKQLWLEVGIGTRIGAAVFDLDD